MKRTNNWKRIAAGALVSLLLYLALLALASLLIVRGAVGEGRVVACVWIFAALSAFAGAKAAAWHSAEPSLSSALCAAAFWGLALLLGFLTNNALEPARAALLALPVSIGGALAYLTRGGGRKRGKRKRRSRK